MFRLLLALHCAWGEPYEMLGVEPELAICKVNPLSAALFLSSPSSKNFYTEVFSQRIGHHERRGMTKEVSVGLFCSCALLC